jgi:hypothetical protein
MNAAKNKSTPSAGMAALRLMLLLVVTLCLAQTRVWGFAAAPQPESGVFESASPSSIGENTIAWPYDAPDSPLAARATEIVAQNGTKITGFTKHGIDRVVGDGAKRAGVKPEALLDALKNPKKITSGVDSQGRPYQVFTGQDARVVVNPQTGQVVSTNPLSGAGAH